MSREASAPSTAAGRQAKAASAAPKLCRGAEGAEARGAGARGSVPTSGRKTQHVWFGPPLRRPARFASGREAALTAATNANAYIQIDLRSGYSSGTILLVLAGGNGDRTKVVAGQQSTAPRSTEARGTLAAQRVSKRCGPGSRTKNRPEATASKSCHMPRTFPLSPLRQMATAPCTLKTHASFFRHRLDTGRLENENRCKETVHDEQITANIIKY